jgi:hypothetical protein
MIEEFQNYNLSKTFCLVNMNRKQVVVNYEIWFYPRYGYCYDIDNYTTNTEVS